jgi:hypothetical protein
MAPDSSIRGFVSYLLLAYVGFSIVVLQAESALPACPSTQPVEDWNNCVGKYSSTQGDVYVGGFREGKRHGFGNNTWPNGAKFVGLYKNGKRDGPGRYFNTNGTLEQSGIWRSGVLIETISLPDSLFVGLDTPSSSVPPVLSTQTKPAESTARARQAVPNSPQDRVVEIYDEWGIPTEDDVARRLRIAAEQEKDPVLKKLLWQRYDDYQNQQKQARLQREQEAKQRAQWEARYQAAIQAEQQQRAKERQEAFYACLAGTREPTFVGAVARCNAEVTSAMRRVTDYEWDWDEFYDQSGDLVWTCRGVQTGQFAEFERCSGRYQTDSRWPGK